MWGMHLGYSLLVRWLSEITVTCRKIAPFLVQGLQNDIRVGAPGKNVIYARGLLLYHDSQCYLINYLGATRGLPAPTALN